MKRSLLTLMAAALTTAAFANEYTFVFDGDNDLYGLTRQHTDKVNDLEFVKEITFSEEGINGTIKVSEGTGKGLALVNAGDPKAGVYISSSVATEVNLTVPGGHITGAKIYLSGYALATLDMDFNGSSKESVSEGNLYYWIWEDAEGGENLTINWPSTFMARYIHSLKLTYIADLGGKQECGLAFSENAVSAVMGEENTYPTLTNPNNLPITWSSSDEAVATVAADGTLTLLKGGKTTITAATTGNDEYAAGNVNYELTVIPCATNILQLKEFAPEKFEQVKVNFPATVTYASGNFAYVTDEDGNAGCFEDIRNQGSTSGVVTIYKVGDVIPAGWIATNASIYGTWIWQGVADDVTEHVEVNYPTVDSVTPEDVDKVVVLQNVTFTTSTPLGNTKAYGTTTDGKTYEFQDTYNVAPKPAGTYDVTALVKYSVVGSTVYFYLAPIAYAEKSAVVAIEEAGTVRYFNLQGKEVAEPESGVFVKVCGEKATKVLF